MLGARLEQEGTLEQVGDTLHYDLNQRHAV